MVADAWRFQMGTAVKFHGIGQGIVVARELWQDRPFYRVLFRCALVPHLCGEDEIELTRMANGHRIVLEARADQLRRSVA